jgi:hypothetical protein
MPSLESIHWRAIPVPGRYNAYSHWNNDVPDHLLGLRVLIQSSRHTLEDLSFESHFDDPGSDLITTLLSSPPANLRNLSISGWTSAVSPFIDALTPFLVNLESLSVATINIDKFTCLVPLTKLRNLELYGVDYQTLDNLKAILPLLHLAELRFNVRKSNYSRHPIIDIARDANVELLWA